MNLKDYYSQQQVMSLLSMKYREQIKRWRNENNIYFELLCSKPFYPRSIVDAYLSQLVQKGSLNPFDVELMKIKQIGYDLDTSEWMPRCEALDLINQGKSSLYKKAQKRIFQQIRTRKAYGFLFFNREDLVDFLREEMSIEEVVAKREYVGVEVTIPKIPDRFFDLDN